MKTVGVRALKQNASAVVAQAAAGEIVVITLRGRAVAQLLPAAQERLPALIAAGRARPARRSLMDLGPAPRRPPGLPPLSETLAELRAGEPY